MEKDQPKINTSYNTPSSIKTSINYRLLGVFSFIVLIVILLFSYFIFFNKSSPSDIPINSTSTFPTLNPNLNDNNEYYTDINRESSDLVDSEYPELLHIWPLPVSGYSVSSVVASSTSDTELGVIFTDELSGNVYVSKAPSFASKRISSENINWVSQSVFSFDHTYGALLSNKLSLFLINIPSKEVTFLEKSLLSEGVLSVAFSKNEHKLAYLKKEISGTSLNIYDINNKRSVVIYKSPLSDINIEWLNNDNILIKTKTSRLTPQTILKINIKTLKSEILTSKNISNKITHDYKNISFDGESLYFSNTIHDLNKIKTKIQSIPDKCSFFITYLMCAESLTTDIYDLPDEWYKGKISFIDHLILYNINTSSFTKYDLSEVAGESIDYYKPFTYLESVAFQNKRDLSLWLLDAGRLILN
jgi:hypothetical protein